MKKVLGLDLGTNSIGWALVKQDEGEYTLLEKGVDIFQEGVAREKNNEKPAVEDRTAARAARRHYFRRRLRKIELLKVLIRYGLCPPLSDEQLDEWRRKKVYPLDASFLQWQRTNDALNKNPYYDRYRALNQTLDLREQADRYTLGRALYHLVQRRGFISNRKDAEKQSEEGKVKSSIKELNQEMEQCGCRYLGEYFYRLYEQKKPIRKKYTSRNEHCLAELKAICRQQHLPQEWEKDLERAIFYQRPLKSQKGLVGKCTFEKSKNRCPASHPLFEEFRMLAFIRNIRMAAPGETDLHPLSCEQVEAIRPLFLRKSKPYFNFEDIAKKLAGKAPFACKGEEGTGESYRFNYPRTTNVSGCPTSAGLAGVLGDQWLSDLCSLYTLGEGKNQEQILDDIWHALFWFPEEGHLRKWAKERFQLSDEQAERFAAIRLSSEYAALSLKAIRKILPYLRKGFRYDQAVFMANLRTALPSCSEQQYEKIENDIAALLEDFHRNPLNEGKTQSDCIREYLLDECPEASPEQLDRLYHPSMIETFPQARPDRTGLFLLGSPRTSSLRNPMAMRALFRLRILINTLLRKGWIDPQTIIRIEYARELNTANMRKAIEFYQREREKENNECRKEISDLYRKETGREIDPTEDELLKYRLWKEQKSQCLYTGRRIGLCDFIGGSPQFDIEHTVPRSRGGEDEQANKTLCESEFNRKVKQSKLPSELDNHSEILARIDALGWKKEIDELRKQIGRLKNHGDAKEERDRAVIRRHYLTMKKNYLEKKYNSFVRSAPPADFANRQKVDVGIISRYASQYLKTVFPKVFSVKGATTADFRLLWGLQEEGLSPKNRDNHVHHCIDAITIACIDPTMYKLWAQYQQQWEYYQKGKGERPQVKKPWPTFTEDVKSIAEALLVSHHTPDNMSKNSRKKLRKRGRILRNKAGEILYAQGDTARGALHLQTFYGAICHQDEIKYVVRKPVEQLKQEEVGRIVDPAVREKVEDAIREVGFKKAVNPQEYTIWMNCEKNIPIRKVRVFVPSVTQPIRLKKHRDLSDKEYKQDYYVTNDNNYCMALYRGKDNKNKTKQTFRLVSALEAAQYFKSKAGKAARGQLLPPFDENGYALACLLRKGTMVLFYENSPEELYTCSQKELARRLYKVTGLSSMILQQKYTYGTVVLKHHQEARPSGELKAKNGAWKINEGYRPIITLLHTQFKAYVQGYDFDLSVTGEITFKHEPPC